VYEFPGGTKQRDPLHPALTKKVDHLERCAQVDRVFLGAARRQGGDMDPAEPRGCTILDARGQIES
jgi:hypothetical protein